MSESLIVCLDWGRFLGNDVDAHMVGELKRDSQTSRLAQLTLHHVEQDS